MRPRRPTPEGTTVGAAIGALLGAGWPGAVIGGMAGAALSSKPVPLETALKEALEAQGLEFVSLYRLGPRAIRVSFGSGNRRYWVVQASVGAEVQDEEEIDDTLFAGALSELDRWKAAHGA